MKIPDELQVLLENSETELSAPLVPDMDSNGNVEYCGLVSVRQIGKRRYPSNQQLSSLTKAAHKRGYNLRLTAVYENQTIYSLAMRRFLKREHGDKIRNAFLTRETSAKWTVWIEVNESAEGELRESIESTASDYMDLFKLERGKIIFVGVWNIPTDTAIYLALRTIAPGSPECLKEALEGRNFFIPNQAWLNRALDRTRRNGSVVRRKDGRYFLSASILSSLGSSGGGNSADVRRALAIPRRFR